MSRTVSEPRETVDSKPEDRGRTERLFPSSETLAVVTNETRRAIISTLWRADDAPLRFSSLRRRSGVDTSARFNYHLQRLRHRFVCDTGDGYELTADGERFVSALRAVPSLDDPSDTTGTRDD